MFASVLVANRGEIARRVIRTLSRLGIHSVAIYVPADTGAPHVREADHAVALDSYLDVDAVVGAAVAAGAEALHPGYGFLSENPDLARACAAAQIAFVGPPPEASELMGDKLAAKDAARRAGLPVVPSYSPEEAAQAGPDDYPLMVKAAAGGGGRGMRVVAEAGGLAAAIESAQREARAGFGDDRVFVERFLPRARHIEVQVIADRHGNVVHLGERECSLQRRHQKVIEESPSPVVDGALRARLGAEAVALAAAGGYVNAGTVEFIADMRDPGEHYFLEMNARLQVEHPVTELVTGLDLVELQLRVAAGEALPFSQDDVKLTGHAVEARINAEDAERDFLPAAGRVLAYHRPGGVRVDDGIEAGSVVDTSFDSLLAKVIAHGSARDEALAKLERALGEMAILGVTTTTGYLRSLLGTDEVRTGQIDTELIGRLPRGGAGVSDEEVVAAAAAITLARRAEAANPDNDPFARLDGWRLGGRRADSWWRLAVGGREPVEVRLNGADAHAATPIGPGRFAVTLAGRRREWWFAGEVGAVAWLGGGGWAWPVREALADEADAAQADGALRAPMPGQVLLVPASVGQPVSAGDPVVVLESMKMELVLTAPADGVVAELSVSEGDRVAVDQPLARVEADS